MEPGILEKVRKLAQGAKVVYVATANKEGVPHIAAEKGMAFHDEDRIIFRAWFCLKTVENLQENPKISLAVLDPKTHEGYQILGVTESVEKGAMLDGFASEKDRGGFPQVEYQLYIRIQAISHLTPGAHSDEFISSKLKAQSSKEKPL